MFSIADDKTRRESIRAKSAENTIGTLFTLRGERPALAVRLLARYLAQVADRPD